MWDTTPSYRDPNIRGRVSTGSLRQLPAPTRPLTRASGPGVQSLCDS